MNESIPTYRIFWVEDQLDEIDVAIKVMHDTLSDILKRKVTIDSACYVEEATLKLNEFKNNLPNIIILDLMLPRKITDIESTPRIIDTNGGYLLWHSLRKKKIWVGMEKVPIVVLSAFTRPIYRPMIEEDNDLQWLDKPVFPSELASVIAKRVETGTFEPKYKQ